jgi:hypothetical protein
MQPEQLPRACSLALHPCSCSQAPRRQGTDRAESWTWGASHPEAHPPWMKLLALDCVKPAMMMKMTTPTCTTVTTAGQEHMRVLLVVS